ncbi:MAG TPA: hypothetical protein VEX69_02510 [Candidatus Limnocylindria bacterium]|nr:hypothetical protein [Candidatus Limnocylindria bacterium]
MFQFIPIAGLMLTVTILAGSQTPQARGADFRARFARESDPYRKAKMMPQYGDLEFQDIHDAIEEGNLPLAVEHFKAYRDQARSIEQSLDAREPDPEKHPAGFKQLQISVRGALRRVEDIIVRLPSEDGKPFQELRKDLEDLDRHLVHELFPRQPATETTPAKPRS